MKNKIDYLTFLLLLSFTNVFSQIKDNPELKRMYDEDQNSRKVQDIDWNQLSKNDSMREKRVYEMLDSGQVVTGKDYYHSAMIFQHGKDTTASLMAVKMMKKAIDLDSTVNKWLLAAAIDRDLMRRDEPQIYGTQYVKMGQDAKWKRYKIDTTKVTDAERKYYRVESLAEQREKARIMNLLSINDFYSKSNSIEQTTEFIKAEKSKGLSSKYNISENQINSFGYSLIRSKKENEALAIFELNTQLYPSGFNAFDSLGECLLLVGNKKEAIKAYEKSLFLNPDNKNAEKILKDLR
ncbi:tetratricopeptide repeat protein [Salmonirosea aquatica]|uniref:Tetratricopeptide repeat protein n=1 Tax=Salmonirosea aquatica TaxID=2654236 RepID=A0A7C9F309_9BACT|nr:tetratricopeptide repeat protein [Cytophagaceae bacterium SJW1-29]